MRVTSLVRDCVNVSVEFFIQHGTSCRYWTPGLLSWDDDGLCVFLCPFTAIKLTGDAGSDRRQQCPLRVIGRISAGRSGRLVI